jgi:hypothetical protein
MMILAYILMNYTGPTLFLFNAVMSRSWVNIIGITTSNPTAPSLLGYSKWMLSKRRPHTNSAIPSHGVTVITAVQGRTSTESYIPSSVERTNALNTKRAYEQLFRLPAQQKCWRSNLVITATWRLGGQPFKCKLQNNISFENRIYICIYIYIYMISHST